eukprot:7568271-Pyramimonas_sp.AAC.1
MLLQGRPPTINRRHPVGGVSRYLVHLEWPGSAGRNRFHASAESCVWGGPPSTMWGGPRPE